MENSWFLLLALISALAFISKTIFKQNPKTNLPPGPKPWPIIGNLNLIASDPRRSIHSLCQKYGDIMLLYFGKFPVVIASSSDMARQFLKVHDSVFASRPPLAAGKYTGYEFKDTGWAPYGPHWKQARKIYHMEVFNEKKFESFNYIRVEERRALVSCLYSESGKTITLKEYLSRYALSIISRMLITKKYFIESGHEKSGMKPNELEMMLEELLELNASFNIGDWIPWLDFLDLQGTIQKMKAVQKKLDRFHNYVIDDHEAMRLADKDFKPKDLLDVLLQKAEDPNLEVKLTRDHVKGLVQVNLFLTFLTFHYSMEDCNVAGYDLAKGTLVLINVWSIMRDPKNWDSPNEFLPERFLGKQVDILFGNNYTLLPFSSGRRRCPGMVLALGVLRATVANLLHGFDLKLAEGASLEDVRLEDMNKVVTNPKVPLEVVVEPTLPRQLY